MLGKLMKYDLRSSFRRFGALWIAIAALAVLNGFSMRGLFAQAAERSSLVRLFVSVLPPMALFGLYLATGILLLVFTCERFYKGLLGDEGYLMFTLPASVSAHIASKTLSAMIVWVLSFLVALVSGFLLLTVYRPEGFTDMLRQLPELLRRLDMPAAVPWLVLEGVLLALAGTAAEILKLYTAIALGHLAKKHRGLWAVLAYIGINTLQSFLFGLFMERAAANSWLNSFFQSWEVAIDDGQWVVYGSNLAAGAMGIAIAVILALCAVYFFVTRLILTKKLNLE